MTLTAPLGNLGLGVEGKQVLVTASAGGIGLAISDQLLAVGARVFPERLSPVTARFDSERQAVELLFEGLLEEVPDPAGGANAGTGLGAVAQ